MWSPQQEKALDRVGQWLKSKDKPVFQLAGFAGTGKTTLAKHFASSVNGTVCFAAYTGKAAHVLMKAGAVNVSTIHKLIYQPKDKSQIKLKELEAEKKRLMAADPIPEKLLRRVEKALNIERDNLARPTFQLNSDSPLSRAALLIIDEYSMVDTQMGEDLLSFGCPILALGDPGQLPPVYGKSFFKDKPDMLLTEIHRQAKDNPIIWLSKEVREGRVLKQGTYGESKVISQAEAGPDMLREMVMNTDQLLVGKNKTRSVSNRRTRELMGFTQDLPVKGEKLVCLRNNHEIGLLNGQLWETVEDSISAEETVFLDIISEEGIRIQTDAHPHHFFGNKPEFFERRNAEEFDYGYALTVHKSQGSQWDNILLFDEWGSRDRAKWLYTAITRAAKRIDIILM